MSRKRKRWSQPRRPVRIAPDLSDPFNPRNLLISDEEMADSIVAAGGPRYTLEEIRQARDQLVELGWIGVALDGDGNVRYDMLPEEP